MQNGRNYMSNIDVVAFVKDQVEKIFSVILCLLLNFRANAMEKLIKSLLSKRLQGHGEKLNIRNNNEILYLL